MRRIATQRDQHPGNRGTLSALPGRRHAATWRDAPVDAYPGREDGQYSSEAVKEEIGNFARDFYQQDGEFRSYADAEEKYGDSPTAWDPFTWASVFEGFAQSKERAGGGLVARRRTASLSWTPVPGEEENFSATGPDGVEFLIYPSGGSYSVYWTLDVLNTSQGILHYPEAFESKALAATMAGQFAHKWETVREMLKTGPVDYMDVQDIPWVG